MRTLVALKKLRYPSGLGGKEYLPGDEFEVLSDRDHKALTLIRAAKEAPVSAPPAGRFPKPAVAAAEPPKPPMTTAAMTPETPADGDAKPATGRRYNRTDMLPTE